jgi:hydroxymethylbilane synthase
MQLTIGSRGSKLALWQAQWVRSRLLAAGHSVQIEVIRTSGDRLPASSLVGSGIKGLFIKEIEEALREGKIDIAVHSCKDLPTEQPPGLVVAAVPERGDARDVLISRDGRRYPELRAGSVVATGSPRRQAQLLDWRRDVKLVAIRGNVDTRLQKLDRGECDALVVAAAGICRLGLAERITSYFDPDELCPAVGQGALAIEIRQDDAAAERAVQPLDHETTHRAVRAERALLQELGGGCSVPVAAHAVAEGHSLHLRAMVASPDGRRLIRAAGNGPIGKPEELGRRLAAELLRQGARRILEEVASLHQA